MLLKMQMQIFVYDANDLKDINTILNIMMQILLKMCHNGFPLDLDAYQNKMESPPIFFIRVWSVTRDACS